MKRIAFVLAAVAVLGLFAACEKKKTDSSASPTDPAASKTAEEAKADPGATTPPPAAPTEPAPATEPAPGSDPAAGPASAAGAGEVASTGIEECDTYIKRLMTCASYPQQGKDTLKASVEGWKKASESGADAAKAAADACKKLEESSEQSLKAMGC
jgi:hypothetical protein